MNWPKGIVHFISSKSQLKALEQMMKLSLFSLFSLWKLRFREVIFFLSKTLSFILKICKRLMSVSMMNRFTLRMTWNYVKNCRLCYVPKVIMQGKLFQRCTHLLYCSVLSLGSNVNTTNVESWHGIHLSHQKSMKYSGHRAR